MNPTSAAENPGRATPRDDNPATPRDAGRGTPRDAGRATPRDAGRACRDQSLVPDLHGTSYGTTGPMVVFCHGLFGQGRNWTQIGKALAADHRVLLLDLPNHGRSEWTDTLDYVDLADRVGRYLASTLEGEPVHLVGHSMGGKIAMLLTLRQPEQISSLTVVDIAPVSYPGLRDFGDYVQAMRSVDLVRLESRSAADKQLHALVPDPVIRGFLLQNLRRNAGSWHWQMNLDLLGDQLDTLGGWPEIKSDPYPGPVLWIGGSESNYVSKEYAPLMRTLFPQLRTVIIKNAGHWVHSEQPAVFLATIRQFVDRESTHHTTHGKA